MNLLTIRTRVCCTVDHLRCYIPRFKLFAQLYSTTGSDGFKNSKMKFHLPKHPVPPLVDTLETYLRTVKPFLSDDEYKNTTKLTNEFKIDGQKLQGYLQEKALKESSWIADWWLNVAYLQFRKPVVMWSSPGLVFPLQTFKSVADQLTYAANMTSSALRYKQDIDNGNIAVDMIGKDPLDMQQYYKIFGTCRIPKPRRDVLLYDDPMSPSKHIIVVHNNTFFKLDICFDDGRYLNTEEIYDNLLGIVESSLDKAIPVGILTSDNRDNWCESYLLLMEDKLNQRTIEEIQKSLFLLCLDNECDMSDVDPRTRAALQLIHGGGSRCNGGNRWFDKTVQFTVNRGGEVGLTYEHSPAEGQPIAIMMDIIVDQLENNMHIVDTSAIRNCANKFEKLPFVVSDSVQKCIKLAEHNLDELVRNLEMACFTYTSYGKTFIKNQKLSPDSYIQLALQYAFYRLHKIPGAQYETASTRKFLHGRTETIRSCSVESVNFAERMLNPSSTKDDKILALKSAIDAHKNYTLQAMNGLGIDRHLFGLKLAAIELGMEIPKLYSDVGFTRSSHMRVSTSQVASKCDGFMCYGPLVEDGYACCYNPRSEDINLATSAIRSCKETDVNSFKDSLIRSLDEMYNLLADK